MASPPCGVPNAAACWPENFMLCNSQENVSTHLEYLIKGQKCYDVFLKFHCKSDVVGSLLSVSLGDRGFPHILTNELNGGVSLVGQLVVS